MIQRTAGILFGLAITILAAPAQAAPDLAACNELGTDPDPLNPRTEAPELPADWADIAQASREWLAVSTELGSTHCSYIGWIAKFRSFDRVADRFLGISWSGYEAFGYLLIDQSGSGTDLDTGAKPVISPSGSFFATIQWSDAGWGGFEGFAVYRILSRRIEPQHVDTDLPWAGWRIDRWEGEECVHLSAVPYSVGNATAPRDSYVAVADNGWKLAKGDTCAAPDTD
ncbi:hypothetical protein [Erythrobacter mangrovi]|uniref:DUF1176 domain-containing protein n=1 Tax=Erythrobacter mangrovi TaxID=2739433 RepID=A0A7D4B850_9SPHN|nr:hypothetical protein [Erythrobacter mangrovi]QKG70101.1 hypothetical protein HQR01_01225 [Erythrobacter mangrovi]